MNSFPLVRKQFALEVGVVDNVQSALVSVFPDFIQPFKDFSARFTTDAPVTALTSKQNKFLGEVQKRNFADIEAVGAYVPEGMKTTYLEYIAALKPAVNHAAGVLSTVLGSYMAFLSQVITNEDVRATTKSFDKDFKEWEKIRIEANDAMGACFAHGSTRSSVSIGQVVDRNSDWQHVFHDGHALFVTMNGVDRAKLKKKVKECEDLLDIVMRKLRNNEFTNVTPQTANNLAEGAYAAACELEFYAAVFFKTQVLYTCVNQTVDHFDEVFKK